VIPLLPILIVLMACSRRLDLQLNWRLVFFRMIFNLKIILWLQGLICGLRQQPFWWWFTPGKIAK
jgi:hypothetical protein